MIKNNKGVYIKTHFEINRFDTLKRYQGFLTKNIVCINWIFTF